MDMQILSGFTPAGGSPDVIATRAPEAGDIVRIVGPNGAVEIPWTSPMAATPTPKPRLLTPNQVIDLMLSVIGPAGFAACVRSDADAMVTWRYKMSVARDITKDQAASGLSIIVAASLMTPDQRTAILAAWPAG